MALSRKYILGKATDSLQSLEENKLFEFKGIKATTRTVGFLLHLSSGRKKLSSSGYKTDFEGQSCQQLWVIV